MRPVVIIGAGLSGAVLAERCATVLKRPVVIIDKRSNIAGNCYDFIDDSGIMVSKYGAHIFHTSDEQVWEYVHNFSEWKPYTQECSVALTVSWSLFLSSIDTVNNLLSLHISSPGEMRRWVKAQTPENLEVKN